MPIMCQPLQAKHDTSGEFSHGTFAMLPDFNDAVDDFKRLPEGLVDALFSNLSKLTLEHKVSNFVTIGLKHKHFDLPDGHFLCEQVLPHKSIMKPHPLAAMVHATPTSFSLDGSSGRWQPYEFVANSSEASHRLSHLQQSPGFLDGVAQVLQESGTSGMFGIHVEHRDHLASNARCNGVVETIETPGDVDHELLIQSVEPLNPRGVLLEDALLARAHQVSWGLNGAKKHTCNGHINGKGASKCHSHCNGHSGKR